MSTNKLLECAEKIPHKLKLLKTPYMFGFATGHSHLTDDQVLQIKKSLNSNNEKIVSEYEQKMAALIGSGYGISFAAGRMAFYSILRALNIGKGDEVILLGFTCSVMPNAVWRVGATPVFADVDKNTFGSDELCIGKKITPRTKLIVAQHSFGIPCNIPSIVEIGKKHGIFVVEDCAITLDSTVRGIKVGNWADASIFSTDHSKPLNTLIGGFFYTRNKSLYEKVKKNSTTLAQLDKKHQERLHQQFLFERKNHMPERYPRSLFINSVPSVIKNLGSRNRKTTFLTEDYNKNNGPNSSYPYPAKMPAFLAQLGLFELERWEHEKQRRKDLLKRYIATAAESGFDKYLPKAYLNYDLDIVPLRFVFQFPNAKKLTKIMSNYIDVNWTWFRNPIVCCQDKPESLGYCYGSCPVSEETGRNIINWPCVLPPGWESKILSLFKQAINEARQ